MVLQLIAKLLFVIEIKYSHAGIDCGCGKTDIVSVEGVRFVDGADVTTRREIPWFEHRTRIARSLVQTPLKS